MFYYGSNIVHFHRMPLCHLLHGIKQLVMLNDPESKYSIMCNSLRVGSLPDLVKELVDKVNTSKDPTQLNVIRGKVLDGSPTCQAASTCNVPYCTPPPLSLVCSSTTPAACVWLNAPHSPVPSTYIVSFYTLGVDVVLIPDWIQLYCTRMWCIIICIQTLENKHKCVHTYSSSPLHHWSDIILLHTYCYRCRHLDMLCLWTIDLLSGVVNWAGINVSRMLCNAGDGHWPLGWVGVIRAWRLLLNWFTVYQRQHIDHGNKSSQSGESKHVKQRKTPVSSTAAVDGCPAWGGGQYDSLLACVLWSMECGVRECTETVQGCSCRISCVVVD